MSRRASRLVFSFLLAVLLTLPGEALAWVETAVRSHQARVEVAKDGSAIVRHELVLKVRGGPMKSLEISGVGTIGEPLSDAVVRRAIEGSSSAWPLTVSSLEDGSLRLGIGAERGIRGGSYLFSFAYALDLDELGRINRSVEGVELSFIGPRLSSGVDSAKVIFVVPRGSFTPRLGGQDDGGAGVLLGEVRRGAEFDEIELVRAHLAIGEPAMWRVLVASDALTDWKAEETGARDLPRTLDEPETASTSLLEMDTLKHFTPVIGLIAFFFGLLTFLKARLTARAASLADARVKPLIPGPPWLRGCLVTVFIAAAGMLVMRHEPWLALFCLIPAAAVATHLLPVRIARPRGPGVWEALQLPLRSNASAHPGSFFETRTVLGFTTFSALIFAILAFAYRILPESNYFALITLSLVVVLVPLFWTGRSRDLPQAPPEQARPWLRFLQRALDPQVVTVELWGRRSALGDELVAETPPLDAYDEARIRLLLRDVPQGLRALEVSLDEAAGACVLPCVVVRVLADSPVMRALPTDVPWQRGRESEERVAILRPTAPTPSQLLRLLKSLLANLRAAGRYSSADSNSDRSLGKQHSTSNESMPGAAQAM